MVIHELKTDPKAFQLLWTGLKTGEVRKFDRPFKMTDFLKLREFDREAQEYSGRHIIAWISDVYDLGEWMPGFCLISFRENDVDRYLKPETEKVKANA